MPLKVVLKETRLCGGRAQLLMNEVKLFQYYRSQSFFDEENDFVTR